MYKLPKFRVRQRVSNTTNGLVGTVQRISPTRYGHMYVVSTDSGEGQVWAEFEVEIYFGTDIAMGNKKQS